MKFVRRTLLYILLADFVYMSVLWFQHNVHFQGKVPVSSFMQRYNKDRQANDQLPKLKWSPVQISSIPDHASRVFLVAEDTRFNIHNGFDLAAIKSALKETISKSKLSRGASTITQQTAKNLYLYPERSWIRKWHELIFTLALELTQTKDRILELYLNIAEFGRGIYGINAAAQTYFGIPASALNAKQAAYLAAALPWPTKHNYKTGTKTFYAHANKIYARSRKESLPLER